MKSLALKSSTLSLIAAFLLLTTGCSSTATEKSFASPDDAVTAIVTAARNHDRPALETIFGPDGEQVLSSGDDVADRNMADHFVQSYDARHSITPGDNGAMILVIGDNDWPFPIPLVKDDKKNDWHFDTAAGKEEILNRRIGRNELYTIQVCRAVADAQREYARMDPDGDGVPAYAEKFISDPGKKNGLYWKTEEGEPQSPLGSLVADAVSQNYTSATNEKGEPNPYHGYYYRMLQSQGDHAEGGAHDYMVNGEKIGGSSAVAYPAQYGNSGVMTFIVDQDGDVFQQDLGNDTATTAKAMTSFDPGPGWEKVPPTTEPTTSPG
jgi:Protein of unknown function (DUF2950)